MLNWTSATFLADLRIRFSEDENQENIISKSA